MSNPKTVGRFSMVRCPFSIEVQGHSPKVTRLISATVVIPSRAFSTAASRRSTVPPARAAPEISLAGRRSRIRARMGSLISTSSRHRCPPAEAAALALFAAHRLVERLCRVPLGVQAQLLQVLPRDSATGRRQAAAEDPHQALGQDAVQGGEEVIGLQAHVEEAPDDVHHVVGVHGGEDQVAGQGGLDGDLGRLGSRGSPRPGSCPGRGAGCCAGRGRRSGPSSR